MKLSVILPVKDERENIAPLLAELAEVLTQFSGAEVIAVDDGSTDGTTQELQSLASKYSFLKVVVLARNFGQTAAIAAGMDHATGDVIIPMDADGQNDPHDIPKLLTKLDEGYDIVSGWRKQRKDPFVRSFFSKFANGMLRRVSGQDIHDYGCTLKAYRRSAVEHLHLYGDMHRFLPAYAAQYGARVCEIPVTHRPRMRGKSKYGFGRIWRVFLDMFMLAFTLKSFTRPMQFFGGIGLLSILLGFLTLIAAIVVREVGGPTLIETPLPVLAALFVIVGVQCALMGILGEMTMRTYFQSQDTKPYRVRSHG